MARRWPRSLGADAAVSWAMPDPQTARDAARVLQMADDVEPFVYVWRRHLTDALLRMIADSGASADHDGWSAASVSPTSCRSPTSSAP